MGDRERQADLGTSAGRDRRRMGEGKHEGFHLPENIDPDTALSKDKPAHNLDKSTDPSWSGQGHGKGHVRKAR